MPRDGIANQGIAMKRLTATAWVLLSCLPTVSAAHHSRAHYTGPMPELQGEVVRLRWGNTHVAVVLKTVAATGEETTWRIDMLGAGGLTPDLLEVGQRLTLAGKESVRGGGDLLATNVRLADGTELLLGAVEPFWSSDAEPPSPHVRIGTRWITSRRAANPRACRGS